jgi:hypothetical protein
VLVVLNIFQVSIALREIQLVLLVVRVAYGGSLLLACFYLGWLFAWGGSSQRSCTGLRTRD